MILIVSFTDFRTFYNNSSEIRGSGLVDLHFRFTGCALGISVKAKMTHERTAFGDYYICFSGS